MSHTFGKVTIADGVQFLEDVGGTGLSGVVIGNESGLTCEVTMIGANLKRTLYPGTVDFFEVPGGRTWNGNLQIDPMAELTNASSYPGSYVRIDTFGPGEKPTGTYPMALPRNTNVGNTVDTNSVGTNTVTNDNNPSATTFVESKVTGSIGSNIIMQNQGLIEVLQWITGVLTQIFKIDPGAASVVKLGNTGLQTEIIGNLLIDQGLTCNGNIFAGAGGSIGGGGLLYSTIGVASFGLSINGKASLDNGAITTDGSGNPTIGPTLQMGNQSTINGKDSAGVQGNIVGVDSGGATYVQAHPTGNLIKFYDKNGVLQWEIASNNFEYNGHVILGVNTGSGELDIQVYSGNAKIYFKGSNGANRASIDSSGNMILAGTLTQSGTP